MKIQKLLIMDKKTDDLIVEFEYLYYWRKPYLCVDATFLNLSHSRNHALKELEDHIYKLWYINPDAKEDDIIESIIDVLSTVINNKGVYIKESDVYSMVYRIFETNIPSDISKRVITKTIKRISNNKVCYEEIETTRRIEWKSNFYELLTLNSIDYDILRKMKSNKDREEYIYKRNKSIKIKYYMKAINTVKTSENLSIIKDAVEALKFESKDQKVTVEEIMEVTGLSKTTINTYVNQFKDMINSISDFNGIKNKKKDVKENNRKLIIETCYDLNSKKVKINKLQLHKETSLNRATIESHWDSIYDLVMDLNKSIKK